MKILHTADWHLGKKLNGFSRYQEQVEVLAEICSIADREKPDLILIAGDLFDIANPSSESTELFYKTLRRLSAQGNRAVVAIAGNHDSPERVAAPDPLARASGIVLVGFPDTVVPEFESENGVRAIRSEPGFVELLLPTITFPVRILLTPFANELRLKKYLDPENKVGELRTLLQDKWTELAEKYCDKQGVNLLVAHLYVISQSGMVEPEGDAERSIAGLGGADAIYSSCIPDQMQYTALGHIHKFWKVATKPAPIIYSSSPLCYSFSEAGQTKYVVMVNIEPGKPADIEPIALSKGKPVLKKSCKTIEEALQWLGKNQHALVELSIHTKNYLSATDTRALHEAHSGIIDIIPIGDLESETGSDPSKFINLELDKAEIFKSYFRKKMKAEPNEEIMALFQEILQAE